jgi:hypothetical protein
MMHANDVIDAALGPQGFGPRSWAPDKQVEGAQVSNKDERLVSYISFIPLGANIVIYTFQRGSLPCVVPFQDVIKLPCVIGAI